MQKNVKFEAKNNWNFKFIFWLTLLNLKVSRRFQHKFITKTTVLGFF